MVEVPEAPPPPPPPQVAEQRAGPSRYELLIDVTPGVDVPLGSGFGARLGPSFRMGSGMSGSPFGCASAASRSCPSYETAGG